MVHTLLYSNEPRRPRRTVRASCSKRITITRTDCFAQRKTLAKASDHDNDFARIKNGGDTNGERHPGDLGDVIVKEACVGKDGVVSEGFDAGARCEGGTYFVRVIR